MPNSKIYFGKIKVRNIKFGTKDLKVFHGKHKNYPTSVSIEDASVTCNSAIYNGSKQVASNIVVVFSGITLVEGVDYTVTKNAGGTNVGTYEIEVTGTGEDYENSAKGTFTINKVTPTVTAPTAKSGLIYNGSAQVLATAGSTNWGTLKYSLDGSTYSTSIPSGTNATSYTIYYRVDGDSNINNVAASYITNSIAKVTPTVTAPTAKSLTYNGSAQALVNAASTNYGTIQYSLDNTTYSTSIPSGTNATSYTVYYKVVGNSNVNDVAAKNVSASIGKADPSYTAPTAKSLTYNTSAQALLNAGSTSDGTIQYSSDNTNWSTTIPTGTNTGSYTSYWRIIGDSNHNDKASASISTTISPKTVSSPTITLSPDSYVYNNTARQPSATVKDGSTTISSGEYTVSYSNNTNAGTATCTITDKTGGNYTVSGSKTFTISKVTPTVTAPTAKSLTYNGSAQQLANAGSTNWGTIQYCLTSGGTYSTSVPSGTNAGDYEVWYKVVGNSNVNDVAAAKITVSIAKADVTYTAPTAKSLTYNGSAQALLNAGAVTGGTIQYSSDNSTWGTAIPSGTNAATYTSYWRIVGDSNHNGKSSASISTTISPKTVSSPTITLSQGTYTYSNTACQPTPTVKDGSVTIASSEYTVSYSNNINAGTATCTITDKTGGNYTVSGSKTFTINKVTPTVTAPTPKTLTFNNANQTLANAGSTNWGTIQYCLNNSGGTYSTTVPSASAANVTYKVWYKVVGNSNINDVAPASIDCMIAEKRVTTPTIVLDPSSYTYNGSARTPDVTVKDGTTVIPASEYTKTFSNNTNAGTATVTITDNTAGNYYISGTTTFTINKANGSVTTAPTAKSLTYNNTAQQLINAGSGTGTMMYKLDSGSWGTSIPTATNATSYTVYYKASASTNYNESASGSVSVTINKVTPTVTAPTAKSLTYNGSAQQLANAGSTNWGTIQYCLTSGGTYSASIPSGTNATSYEVWYKVVGNSNVNDVAAAKITVNIAKANPTYTAPTANNRTYDTTSKALLNAGSTSHGTIQYSSNNSTWSTTIPTGTTAGSYTSYWRLVGDSNHNDVASTSISTTIAKANGSVTINGVSLTYNGSAQNLATVSNNTGTMHYSTNGTSWSTSIPTGTNATAYTVYWYMDASTNYNAIASASTRYVSSTIGKANQSAPTATVTAATYPGTSSASASGGGGQGSLSWTNGSSRSAVGTQDTYAYWAGNSNYNASPNSNKVTLSVSKFTPTVTLAATDRAYNGNALYATASVATPSGGVATKGTIYYGTTSGAQTYSVTYGGSGSVNLSSVSVTNVGSATVYAYFVPDSSCNGYYNNSGNVSKTFTVSKANQSAPTATGATVAFHNTATATASGGGGQGTLTWTNGNTRTATGTTTTAAYWSGNGNYNASPNSNSVSLVVNKATDQSVTVTLTNRTYSTSAQVVASATSHGCTFYLGFGASSTSAPTSWGAANSSISQTNAGTYYVWYKGTADGNHSADISATYKGIVTIGKADQSAPTATGATTTYPTGATATASGGGGQGTLTWSNGSSRSTCGSQNTKAYWAGNSNYNSSPYSNEVTITVNKGACPSYTAPTAKTGLVYNGSSQTLYNAGSSSNGTFGYSNGTRTAAGTQSVSWSFTPTDSCRNGASGSFNATIAQKAISIPTPTGVSRAYNGSAATATFPAATGAGITKYRYSTNGSSWTETTSNPSQTNAGTLYTQAYYSANDANYSGAGWSSSATLAISKADQSAPGATGATTTYPTTATAKASGGGGVGSIEWESAQSQSSVGSHTTRARWTGNGNYNASPWSSSVTVQMNQAGGSVTTAPVNTNYTYNGTARAVASAGSGTGTMYYRLGASGSFSTTMPTMTNAGSNTLYYYAAASTNYTQSSTGSITVSVQRANISPTVSMAGWTYGGTASNPSVAGNSGSGSVTYYYKVSGAADSTYTTTKPSNAGTYIIRADIAVTTNYNSGSCTNSFTIAKASPSYTAPTANNRTYDGTSKALLNAGSTSHGTIYYSANNSSWSTAIPSGSTAGSYTTYWKITGDSNHTDKASASIGTTISKANISPSVSMAGWTYGGTPTNPSVAGNSGSGTVTYYYKLSTESSWTTTKPTSSSNAGTYNVRADIAATTNYNSGSCSSSFTIAKAQGTATVVGKTLQYTGGYQPLCDYSNNTGALHFRANYYPIWQDGVPHDIGPNSYIIHWYMDESTNYTGIASADSRYVNSVIEDIFVEHVTEYTSELELQPSYVSYPFNAVWNSENEMYYLVLLENPFIISNFQQSEEDESCNCYATCEFYARISNDFLNKTLGRKHIVKIEYDKYQSGAIRNRTETDQGWTTLNSSEIFAANRGYDFWLHCGVGCRGNCGTCDSGSHKYAYECTCQYNQGDDYNYTGYTTNYGYFINTDNWYLNSWFSFRYNTGPNAYTLMLGPTPREMRDYHGNYYCLPPSYGDDYGFILYPDGDKHTSNFIVVYNHIGDIRY